LRPASFAKGAGRLVRSIQGVTSFHVSIFETCFGTHTYVALTLERPKRDRGQASDRRAAPQLKFQRSMSVLPQEQSTMRTRHGTHSYRAWHTRFRDGVARLPARARFFHDAQVFERGPRIGPLNGGEKEAVLEVTRSSKLKVALLSFDASTSPNEGSISDHERQRTHVVRSKRIERSGVRLGAGPDRCKARLSLVLSKCCVNEIYAKLGATSHQNLIAKAFIRGFIGELAFDAAVTASLALAERRAMSCFP